jgi:hypothetical protein
LPPRRRDELGRLSRVERERLLAEDRLACLDREHGRGEVPGMRRGNVDHVDVRVLDQALVRRVPAGHAEPLAERVCRLLRAGPDCDHLGVG